MFFEDLPIIEPIRKALREEGYSKPTPIQEQSIPPLLERRDLLGCAQTGTGKTASFAIPILQLMTADTGHTKGRRQIRALILTPTRELALQIGESFAAYGRHLRLRHTVIFGGVNQFSQVKILDQGVDILVATPGRLLDLMQQGIISLRDVAYFTLDEADRMLDMGFIHDVRRVIAKLPAERQTLLFSATMPDTIKDLANSILRHPVNVAVTPVSSTVDLVQQSVFFVDKTMKPQLLLHLLRTEPIETVLVFTRTKHGADRVSRMLTREGIRSEAIHGNKSQNARQTALANFKSRTTRVLVATDIAARGIDISELAYVINFEIPHEPETYVHRIGRTGRAGASGKAYSFCDQEERNDLRDIQKLIKKTIEVNNEHPYANIPAALMLPNENFREELPPQRHRSAGNAPRQQQQRRPDNRPPRGQQQPQQPQMPRADQKPQQQQPPRPNQPAPKGNPPAPARKHEQRPPRKDNFRPGGRNNNQQGHRSFINDTDDFSY